MSSKTLNAQLLRQLECPVCKKTCVPHIYMCCNGHIVCAKCQAQLNECSECSAPGKPTLRNVHLEKIAALVKLPCANQQHGCELTFDLDDLARHLPKCEHGFECHLCKAWIGCARDLKDHVIKEHPLYYFKFPSAGSIAMWTDVPTKEEYHNQAQFRMFSLDNDIFWLEDEYKSSTHRYSTTLRIVSYEAKDASRYFYSVEFKSKHETNNCRVFHQAEVLTEDASTGSTEIFLPDGMVDSYEDGIIEYTFKISLNK